MENNILIHIDYSSQGSLYPVTDTYFDFNNESYYLDDNGDCIIENVENGSYPLVFQAFPHFDAIVVVDDSHRQFSYVVYN